MHKNNPYWKEHTDAYGRTYAERIDDPSFREYQLDPVIAERIKDLRLGLSGCNKHTWRAIAIAVTGFEDQMTGKDLCKLAAWTLGEDQWD